jgi:hypothetical protein
LSLKEWSGTCNERRGNVCPLEKFIGRRICGKENNYYLTVGVIWRKL